ncbi:MAG: ATPase [Bacteroidales bacterium]|nr:ATPase [Bacteroidales bacterium]
MKLIIDSGATKADWCLTDGMDIVREFKTAGMSVSVLSEEEIAGIIMEGAVTIGNRPVTEVHFYAAGLIEGSEAAARTKDILSKAFGSAAVEGASDMLGAARAACGSSEGICAILGTGSNSCLYDGDRIVHTARSGGFILGDEGGGACLGKLFLSDYVKDLVPEPLSSEFGSAFDVDYTTIVRKVYKEPAPSAYLGSFAPWILEHRGDPYVDALVERNLTDFFDRSLLRHGRTDLPAGFVGGFAAACATQLRSLADSRGIRISRILASPMEGLLDYHGL